MCFAIRNKYILFVFFSQGVRVFFAFVRAKLILHQILGGINMKNQQTIMCDVEACKYHNCENCCCNLSQITVTPCDDCETAHYWGNYVKKDNY